METKAKRNKGKIVLLLAVMLTMLFAVSVNAQAASYKSNGMNRLQRNMHVGKHFTLKSNKDVSYWTVNNSKVVSISGNGNSVKVTAKKKGTTRVYAHLENGSKTYCVFNVRANHKSSYVTDHQMEVMLNIMGAVESGGQVYGKRDYAAFCGPGANVSSEVGSTAGAFQEYDQDLIVLLRKIKRQYPYTFAKYDKAGIASDVKKYNKSNANYAVSEGSAKAKSIVNIINSKHGRIVQDLYAQQQIDTYLKHIRSLGVTNVRTALFLADCEHQGGRAAVERVVKRASNKNSLNSMLTSVLKDQQDSTPNQIGDYPTRRNLVAGWLKTYIKSSTVTLKK